MTLMVDLLLNYIIVSEFLYGVREILCRFVYYSLYNMLELKTVLETAGFFWMENLCKDNISLLGYDNFIR